MLSVLTNLNCYHTDNDMKDVPFLNAIWGFWAAIAENDTFVVGKKAISLSSCVSLVVGINVPKTLVVTGFEIVKDDVVVHEPENKLDENDVDVLGNIELVDLADVSNDNEPVVELSELVFNAEDPKREVLAPNTDVIAVFVFVFGWVLKLFENIDSELFVLTLMEVGLSNPEESFFHIPPKIFFPVLSNFAIPNMDVVGVVDDVINEKDVVDDTCPWELVGLQIFKFSGVKVSDVDFCISFVVDIVWGITNEKPVFLSLDVIVLVFPNDILDVVVVEREFVANCDVVVLCNPDLKMEETVVSVFETGVWTVVNSLDAGLKLIDFESDCIPDVVVRGFWSSAGVFDVDAAFPEFPSENNDTSEYSLQPLHPGQSGFCLYA